MRVYEYKENLKQKNIKIIDSVLLLNFQYKFYILLLNDLARDLVSIQLRSLYKGPGFNNTTISYFLAGVWISRFEITTTRYKHHALLSPK